MATVRNPLNFISNCRKYIHTRQGGEKTEQKESRPPPLLCQKWMLTITVCLLQGETPLKSLSFIKVLLQHHYPMNTSNKDLGFKLAEGWVKGSEVRFWPCAQQSPGKCCFHSCHGTLVAHYTCVLKGHRATGSRQQGETHHQESEKSLYKDTKRWRWPREADIISEK